MTTTGQRIALVFWTIGFAIGAANHAHDIMSGGWLPYRFAPIGCNIFWTALLPIDLVVAALLWLRRSFGLYFGLGVMVADVAVNSWVIYRLGFPELASSLQLQSMFLGGVIGSIGWLMPRAESGRAT